MIEEIGEKNENDLNNRKKKQNINKNKNENEIIRAICEYDWHAPAHTDPWCPQFYTRRALTHTRTHARGTRALNTRARAHTHTNTQTPTTHARSTHGSLRPRWLSRGRYVRRTDVRRGAHVYNIIMVAAEWYCNQRLARASRSTSITAAYTRERVHTRGARSHAAHTRAIGTGRRRVGGPFPLASGRRRGEPPHLRGNRSGGGGGGGIHARTRRKTSRDSITNTMV